MGFSNQQPYQQEQDQDQGHILLQHDPQAQLYDPNHSVFAAITPTLPVSSSQSLSTSPQYVLETSEITRKTSLDMPLAQLSDMDSHIDLLNFASSAPGTSTSASTATSGNTPSHNGFIKPSSSRQSPLISHLTSISPTSSPAASRVPSPTQHEPSISPSPLLQSTKPAFVNPEPVSARQSEDSHHHLNQLPDAPPARKISRPASRVEMSKPPGHPSTSRSVSSSLLFSSSNDVPTSPVEPHPHRYPSRPFSHSPSKTPPPTYSRKAADLGLPKLRLSASHTSVNLLGSARSPSVTRHPLTATATTTFSTPVTSKYGTKSATPLSAVPPIPPTPSSLSPKKRKASIVNLTISSDGRAVVQTVPNPDVIDERRDDRDCFYDNEDNESIVSSPEYNSDSYDGAQLTYNKSRPSRVNAPNNTFYRSPGLSRSKSMSSRLYTSHKHRHRNNDQSSNIDDAITALKQVIARNRSNAAASPITPAPVNFLTNNDASISFGSPVSKPPKKKPCSTVTTPSSSRRPSTAPSRQVSQSRRTSDSEANNSVPTKACPDSDPDATLQVEPQTPASKSQKKVRTLSQDETKDYNEASKPIQTSGNINTTLRDGSFVNIAPHQRQHIIHQQPESQLFTIPQTPQSSSESYTQTPVKTPYNQILAYPPSSGPNTANSADTPLHFTTPATDQVPSQLCRSDGTAGTIAYQPQQQHQISPMPFSSSVGSTLSYPTTPFSYSTTTPSVTPGTSEVWNPAGSAASAKPPNQLMQSRTSQAQVQAASAAAAAAAIGAGVSPQKLRPEMEIRSSAPHIHTTPSPQQHQQQQQQFMQPVQYQQLGNQQYFQVVPMQNQKFHVNSSQSFPNQHQNQSQSQNQNQNGYMIPMNSDTPMDMEFPMSMPMPMMFFDMNGNPVGIQNLQCQNFESVGSGSMQGAFQGNFNEPISFQQDQLSLQNVHNSQHPYQIPDQTFIQAQTSPLHSTFSTDNHHHSHNPTQPQQAQTQAQSVQDFASFQNVNGMNMVPIQVPEMSGMPVPINMEQAIQMGLIPMNMNMNMVPVNMAQFQRDNSQNQHQQGPSQGGQLMDF